MTVIPKGRTQPITPALADATAALPARAQRTERDSKVAGTIADRLRDQWLIQIGAYNDKKSAHEKLREAQDETKVLRDHLAYTEPVQKNDLTLYRARFAGFDRDAAKDACRQLKKAKFSCLPMRQ
jgi:D-alanyl-D-alanine carboxypeptidase